MNYLDLLFVLLNGVFGVAILFFIAYDKLAHELGVLFKLGLWACGLGILLQAFGSAGVFFSVSPQIKPQYDHNNVAIWILSAGTWIMSIACSRLQFKKRKRVKQN